MSDIIEEGGTEIDEAMCPLCSKPVRSDANAPAFCGLCGMGIDLIEDAPSTTRPDRERIYFCCDRCKKIFLRIQRKNAW